MRALHNLLISFLLRHCLALKEGVSPVTRAQGTDSPPKFSDTCGFHVSLMPHPIRKRLGRNAYVSRYGEPRRSGLDFKTQFGGGSPLHPSLSFPAVTWGGGGGMFERVQWLAKHSLSRSGSSSLSSRVNTFSLSLPLKTTTTKHNQS